MRYNDSYDAWAAFDTLPKLYYEGSKELENGVNLTIKISDNIFDYTFKELS